MSGATFPRVKNWTTEILSNTDLNAEIDNILNNLGPAGIDTYSATAAQMKLTTNPGATGTESLATSLAGELERLRYVIKRIAGSSVTNWYDVPPSTLSDLVSALGSGLPGNRIVSGLTTGNSSQMNALQPSGTTTSVTLKATATNFIYYVNGVQYSITADQTLTGLPALTVTATATPTNFGTFSPMSDQQFTRVFGQYDTVLPVQNMSAPMAAAAGTIVALQNKTECFLGYISSSTVISNAFRGCFFNQSATFVPAQSMNSGTASVRLMKLSWIYANTSSSLVISNTNPTIAGVQPTAPVSGDYWFDLSTTAWKTFNSTTWVAANATLIGMTVQDTTACVAARTFDSYKAFDSLNTVKVDRVSGTVLQANDILSEVNVYGTKNSFITTRPSWSSATNMVAGETLSAANTYFMYMSEAGVPYVSNVYPYYRRNLRGMYHPGETWRCLGSCDTDGALAFQTAVKTFSGEGKHGMLMIPSNYYAPGGFADVVSGFTAQLTDVYPTRYITSGIGTVAYSFAQGAWGDFFTISLTPGLWGLSAVLCMQLGSGTVQATDVQFGISTFGTATFTDLVYGLNANKTYLQGQGAVTGTAAAATSSIVGTASFTLSGLSLVIPRLIIRQPTTASASYYVKGFMTSTAGATYTVLAARITAERLDDLNGMPL